MAKDIIELKRTISLIGFEQPNGRWGITVYTHAIVTCFLIINYSVFVVSKWEDVGKRLDGIKGLFVYIMCSMYFLALTSSWDSSMLLIKIIEEGLHEVTFRSSTKDSKLRKRIENDVTQLNTIWYYGIMGYGSMVFITPIAIFVIRLFQYNFDDLTVDLLYTSVPFYFPKSYENFFVYILAYLMQSTFLLYSLHSGYVTLVTAFNSMQLIEGELRLLRLSIDEFDSTHNGVDKRTGNDESNVYVTDYNTIKYSFLYDSDCKRFLRYFVKHHYVIYRKVNDVTKGIQLVAFSVNSAMSLLLCTSIYSIAKRKELLVITQEAAFGSSIAFCIYCYNLMGEKILTQDEHLRRTLFESTWIDKPQWFKKSLQIIMTRINRPVEIKLVGLFVLNLRNFILTVRAAYSYYNLLKNL